MAFIEIEHLVKHYTAQRLFGRHAPRTVRAVDDVSFSIDVGHTFGLVGESGCGKSTLARMLVGVVAPTRGDIRFEGRSIRGPRGAERAALRRQVQVVFQDPYSSLNPSFTVRTVLWEGLRQTAGGRHAPRSAYLELLDMVGLPSAVLDRYPYELSGGQRQRVSIARALSVRPRFIVADEPVSALDVSLQAQILNLLIGIQRELSLTYLVISHDLNVIRYICDEVAVMYLGKIVEQASTAALFAAPQHPYTQVLMDAAPRPGWSMAGWRPLQGELPSPFNPPPGCRFNPRCMWAQEVCRTTEPPLRILHPTHLCACHRAEEINDARVTVAGGGTTGHGSVKEQHQDRKG